ncbi:MULTISPECIES: toxin-antitoxin system HicB family antitoxin [Spirulina sp. CCY15215]|uniref:toxin-antitoxin system HicB family antitoxin n=1 Tax=Spirulina sp. CCY15215 TaxID=2767591 RepID=UPI00195069F8|nr:toxin-antitoxin system HicB family antitoxin [Spirulina major]
MSELTISLPENLYQKLTALATENGFSTSQYITYLLIQQLNSDKSIEKVSEPAIAQQKKFTELLETLGKVSQEETEIILKAREQVDPDEGLTSEIIARFQQKILECKKH